MIFNKKDIVFGCWPISGDYGIKQNNKSILLIKKAIDWGICEFDTAPNYGRGNSEKLLANLNKKYNDKILVNTKIGNSPTGNKSFDIKFLKKSFEDSLSRLKMKKINILFLHNPRNIKNTKEILSYLKKLKKKKLIKKFGLSLANDYKYSDKFLNKFEVLQYDFSILCQKKYLQKFKHKKLIHKRSIYGSGTITEKFLKKKIFNFKKIDQRSRWLDNKKAIVIKKHLTKIKKITNTDLDTLAYTFVKKNLGKNKIIIGFKTCDNLKKFKNIYNSKISRENYTKIKKYYFSQLKRYNERPLV